LAYYLESEQIDFGLVEISNDFFLLCRYHVLQDRQKAAILLSQQLLGLMISLFGFLQMLLGVVGSLQMGAFVLLMIR
jgi:hypothetical protein